MKLIYRLLIPLVFIAGVSGCDKTEKERNREYPRIITLDVSDINESGARFNAEIISRSTSDIIDYGFVWDKNKYPEINSADKVIFMSDPTANNFSADITTTLNDGIEYYVRSFVQTADYLVYGNMVGFVSLGSMAPKILSFSPQSGVPGDTILIYGKNFSYRNNENKVMFGYNEASLISTSDSILKVIVPSALETDSSLISVEVTGNVARSTNPFALTTPVIENYTPDTGTESTEVTIEGKNFCYLNDLNIVRFGDLQATVLEATKSRLRVRVPAGINQSSVTITVSIANKEGTSSTPFRMLSPVIYSFTPLTGYLRAKITINGKYFGSVSQNIRVSFNNIPATLISSSDSIIEVNVPAGLPLDNIKINVVAFDQTAISSEDFHLQTPEIIAVDPAKATIGKSIIISGSAFSPQAGDNQVLFNGINAQIISNTTDALTAVVPPGITERAVQVTAATGEYQTSAVNFEYVGADWSASGNFPGGTRTGAAGFLIGDKYYMGLGSHGTVYPDFWSYDINTQTWTRLADFPGDPRVLSVAFAMNGKGYVGMGINQYTYYKDFWEYDPVNDTWTQITDFPGDPRREAICIIVDNRCFVGLGLGSGYVCFKDLYEFDAVNKTWLTRSDFPGKARCSAATFTIGSNAYLGFGSGIDEATGFLGYLNDFWKYDNVSDSWTRMSDITAPVRAYTASFSTNGRGYIGLGYNVIDHGSYDFNTVLEYNEQEDTWVESVPDPYGPGSCTTYFDWNGSLFMIFRQGPNSDPATHFEIFTPFN